VVRLVPSLKASISASIATLTHQLSSPSPNGTWRDKWDNMVDPVRVNRDIPFLVVLLVLLLMPLPLFFLFFWILPGGGWGIPVFATISSLLCGFMFGSVGAYMAGISLSPTHIHTHSLSIYLTHACERESFFFHAHFIGLVGSSNNPISGVTLATIVTCSFFLVLILGRGEETGPTAAIVIGSVIACAAGVAGDNMQVRECHVERYLSHSHMSRIFI
jgi:uncharacterized oligopeptide transporter (OPT) family protein